MADLDAERIAAAALSIANKRGAEGFSMRAVAEALDVTPMALYHHVKDKAALVALVVDATLRNNPLPPPIGHWQDDLMAMAHWIRASIINHPVVGRLRREFDVWTPSMLRMTERWLGLWQQSGLAIEQAMLAATTSSIAITGIVHEEIIFSALVKPDDATLSLLPNVRTMFKSKHDPEAQFELVVRSLIEGLHARLAAQCNAKPKPTASRTLRKRASAGS